MVWGRGLKLAPDHKAQNCAQLIICHWLTPPPPTSLLAVRACVCVSLSVCVSVSVCVRVLKQANNVQSCPEFPFSTRLRNLLSHSV